MRRRSGEPASPLRSPRSKRRRASLRRAPSSSPELQAVASTSARSGARWTCTRWRGSPPVSPKVEGGAVDFGAEPGGGGDVEDPFRGQRLLQKPERLLAGREGMLSQDLTADQRRQVRGLRLRKLIE